MHQKSPRNIVVKMLCTVDRHLDFKNECEIAGESQSKTLDMLAGKWSAQQKSKRSGGSGGASWPCAGHTQAMFMPGRPKNYSSAHMRRLQ